MKFVCWWLFLASAVSGSILDLLAPPGQFNNSNEIPVTSYVNENNNNGSNRYSYKLGNGILVTEEGQLKNSGKKDLKVRTAEGYYSYTAPDGQLISVSWYAGETGYHAKTVQHPLYLGRCDPPTEICSIVPTKPVLNGPGGFVFAQGFYRG